jgi:hypothetical protein
LSKDIENLGACIGRSNIFFTEITSRLQIDPSGIMDLRAGTHINEIEKCLKQNELTVLNRLIFKNSAGEIQMFSAQSEESE